MGIIICVVYTIILERGLLFLPNERPSPPSLQRCWSWFIALNGGI
ncbi:MULTISPECIES: hypothetical protein [Serratia]|nr:hypothetical protein [Serratia marcescens]